MYVKYFLHCCLCVVTGNRDSDDPCNSSCCVQSYLLLPPPPRFFRFSAAENRRQTWASGCKEEEVQSCVSLINASHTQTMATFPHLCQLVASGLHMSPCSMLQWIVPRSNGCTSSYRHSDTLAGTVAVTSCSELNVLSLICFNFLSLQWRGHGHQSGSQDAAGRLEEGASPAQHADGVSRLLLRHYLRNRDAALRTTLRVDPFYHTDGPPRGHKKYMESQMNWGLVGSSFNSKGCGTPKLKRRLNLLWALVSTTEAYLIPCELAV